jgi:hypothetical protein
MKYYIIASIENQYSDRTESFDCLSDAKEYLEALTHKDCLDPYYSNLKSMGGELRIEDNEGNGY